MTVERRMPRIQEVVIPLLRDAEIRPGLHIGSWIKQVKTRTYPLINVRRLGGLSKDPERLDLPVIELTVFVDSRNGALEEAENIYLDARKVLRDAVWKQTVVPGVGYLHSYFDTMGMTPFDSPFEDAWRVQGLIQLGLRPARH